MTKQWVSVQDWPPAPLQTHICLLPSAGFRRGRQGEAGGGEAAAICSLTSCWDVKPSARACREANGGNGWDTEAFIQDLYTFPSAAPRLQHTAKPQNSLTRIHFICLSANHVQSAEPRTRGPVCKTENTCRSSAVLHRPLWVKSDARLWNGSDVNTRVNTPLWQHKILLLLLLLFIRNTTRLLASSVPPGSNPHHQKINTSARTSDHSLGSRRSS